MLSQRDSGVRAVVAWDPDSWTWRAVLEEETQCPVRVETMAWHTAVITGWVGIVLVQEPRGVSSHGSLLRRVGAGRRVSPRLRHLVLGREGAMVLVRRQRGEGQHRVGSWGADFSSVRH